MAIFSENLVQLAALSRSHPDADGFFVVWRRVIAMTLESTAFVAAFMDAAAPTSWRGDHETTTLLAEPLTRAQRAGLVTASLTPNDLLIVVRAAHGLVVTSPTSTSDVDLTRLLTLIDPALGVHAAE